MRTIRVRKYDAEWASIYRNEEKVILTSLAAHISHIHHVGSTSIANMPAKPIIDVCIESEVYPPDEQVNALLEAVGYRNMGEFGVSGRIWFQKIAPFACNLHWCPLGGDVPRSQLKFKRLMSENKSLADEYASLKVGLNDLFEEGSLEYNKRKAPFIQKVLNSEA